LYDQLGFIQVAQAASYLGHNFEVGLRSSSAAIDGCVVPIGDLPVTQAEAGRIRRQSHDRLGNGGFWRSSQQKVADQLDWLHKR
jgi:hypothetical protein